MSAPDGDTIEKAAVFHVDSSVQARFRWNRRNNVFAVDFKPRGFGNRASIRRSVPRYRLQGR